jgi:16S rRNA (guanine527-N7)-methyltransferase
VLDKLTHAIETAAKQSGLSDVPAEKLARFVMLMDKWNKAYNLTSVRHVDDMVERHIIDSLVVGPYLKGERFIDVGTGPGLPGLPLAIFYPERHFTLLDSNGKRTRFMFQAALELGINNVEIIHSRVEQYQPETGYDGVLSRAFASLSDMLTWCAHLPNDHGRFYALKAHLSEQELSEIPKPFKVIQQHQLRIFATDRTRHLLEIASE